jgi:hypothetical protein
MNRTLLHAAFKALALLVVLPAVLPLYAEEKPVYRCPGTPPLYTDQISAKEAASRGCKTLAGAPITVMQSGNPKREGPAPKSNGAGNTAGNPRPETRIDPGEQRARDSDARQILEAELRREEERLASLQKEFNGGEPDRRGDERNNYEKYQERVNEMRAAIGRKESDIAAIRRELAKLSPS